MNTDVEDLLRQGMTRFTEDLRAPAGLIRTAERRRHRRRLAQFSVAVATAAALAACAAVLAVLAVPGAPRGTAASPTPGNTSTLRQVIDAAYVTKRVDAALSAAGPAEIAQLTFTTDAFDGATTAKEWSYGDQWRSVHYSSDGQPVYQEGGDASVFTLVSYPARTWSRQSGVRGSGAPASGHDKCLQAAVAMRSLLMPGAPRLGPSAAAPASVVTLLHTAVSCGSLTVAGRQQLDGIDAIRLTSKSGSPLDETIWVSRATYLPVRVVLGTAAGSPALRHTADITWLQPTAQNLAKLTVPIPAGYRRVPFAPVVVTPTTR
jgi:hypothetical protein